MKTTLIAFFTILLLTGCNNSAEDFRNSDFMKTENFCKRAGNLTIYKMPVRCYEYYNIKIEDIQKLNNLNINLNK